MTESHRHVDANRLLARVGVVVIGRNEGNRLVKCLQSMPPGVCVVYVDSGSTDGSVARARELGSTVVELDMSTRFTAARARNAGLDRLLAMQPGTEFVQFVDGDCELHAQWLLAAATFLLNRPEVAAVAGRLRERNRHASIYNRLCDLEWDAPAGEAEACGGIAMMRVSGVVAAGGFRATLIAGEEPELCQRLRLAGHAVWRLNHDMGWHDAAMTRFGQWWKRARRAGYAFTEVMHLHRHSPIPIWRRDVRGIAQWGLVVPAVAVLAAWPTFGLSLLLLAGYPLLFARILLGLRHRGWTLSDRLLCSAACVVAKFPQAIGMLQYWRNHMLNRSASIIEYKSAAPQPVEPNPFVGAPACVSPTS